MRNSLLQIKSFLFITSFFAIATIANAQDRPFITVWQTDNPGSSEDNQITIPGTGTDYLIEWEEVGNEANNNGSEIGTNEHTVTFPNAGTYRVKISGDFTRIEFNNQGDKEKILDIAQWGDIQWTSFEDAFYGCKNFNLSSTDNPILTDVTNMSNMFRNATVFTGIISDWNVSNVTDMSSMFYKATNFDGNIGEWDVSNVTDMSFMFSGASSFNSPLNSWDVSSVLFVGSMFSFATSFNQDLTQWELSEVTSFNSMFLAASSFNGDLSNWDISKVTDMNNMFQGASSFNQDLSNWNVSDVTSMRNMFFGAESFNQDIGGWDVSSVTTTEGMFRNASSFNSDLNSWDVSNVNDMSFMFREASSFNGEIGGWNVSNVNDMRYMFSFAFSFNKAIGNWDVSNVFRFTGMFNNADSFNQILDNWNTSNARFMVSMFYGADSFNQDLNNWDVSSVVNMSEMFFNAESFNGELNNWDISSVTDMTDMFYTANSFNQNLGDWSIVDSINMTGLFDFSGMDLINFDKTLQGWAAQQNIASNIMLGAQNISFCFSEDERDFLTDEKGWIISGATKDCETGAFTTTWNSANEGESLSNQITIPANGGNYVVLWEDIDDTSINGLDSASGYHTIDFPVSGNYRVKIFGDLTSINFSDLGDKLKITEIEQWGDIQWTNFNAAFAGAENLTITANDAPDLSQVTDMSRMFYNAKSINQDISNWNVSNVTNMSDLFHGASAFNQDLSTWNVSNVTNMSRMFASATAFNQDLTEWNTANVTDMDFMFWDADSFQGDISSWDVTNVNNMLGLFYSADSVNSDISNWDVSSVTSMTEMFREAKAFNQDISSWNTANVADISGMFYEATSFDQDLGDWNLSNAGSLFEFLTNAGLSPQNYDATLEGWATNGTIPRDIALSAEGLAYCASEEYRQQLIDDFGWGIIGDVQCSLVLEETFPAAEATHIEKDTKIYLTFDQTFEEIDFSKIELSDISGNSVTINSVVADSLTLRIIHSGLGFNTYEVTIPENTLVSASGKVNDEIKWSFATQSILAAKDKQLATNLANYPNPFSDYTTLRFSLTEGNSFDLLVYDVKGQLVRQESYSNRASGEQSIKFERKGLRTGLYHFQIQSAKGAVSGKMMIK